MPWLILVIPVIVAGVSNKQEVKEGYQGSKQYYAQPVQHHHTPWTFGLGKEKELANGK